MSQRLILPVGKLQVTGYFATARNIGTITMASFTINGHTVGPGGAVTLGWTDFSGANPVSKGGTGIASGTSGGVPYFSGSTTIASSAALAAGKIVAGGGTGAAPATEANWSFSSHQLLGNFNSAAAPAVSSAVLEHIVGADSAQPQIFLDCFGDLTAVASQISFRGARGTNASPSAVHSGDALGQFGFWGYGATGYSGDGSAGGSAYLQAYTTEAWTDTAQGAGLRVFANQKGAGGGTLGIVATFTYEGTAIKGTTTNDDAAAGFVGEYVSSNIPYASAVSLTTDTNTNMTSISLTAGDWDVQGNVHFVTSSPANATVFYGALTSTSATFPDISLYSEVSNGGAINPGFNVPSRRFSLASTTTIYLVTQAHFTAGTATVCGNLSARRVR